jgi:hypothetical protein
LQQQKQRLSKQPQNDDEKLRQGVGRLSGNDTRMINHGNEASSSQTRSLAGGTREPVALPHPSTFYKSGTFSIDMKVAKTVIKSYPKKV